MAIIEKSKAIAIFEVKTSCSFSEQLYKGIGQLVSYKYYYGTSVTKLFLVVPSVKNNKEILSTLMDDLGICLVEYNKNGFSLTNGDDLNEYLRKQNIV